MQQLLTRQLGDGEFSGFGIELNFPAALVGGVVMPRTQWDHVVQIGRTSFFPIINVVHVAVIKNHFTIRNRTCRVDRFKCSSLVNGR